MTIRRLRGLLIEYVTRRILQGGSSGGSEGDEKRKLSREERRMERRKRRGGAGGASIESEGLAIVGIGSRWPGGSDDTEQFWAMLVEGRSGTGKLGEKRGGAGMTGLPGGFLDEVDKFSPGFFWNQCC